MFLDIYQLLLATHGEVSLRSIELSGQNVVEIRVRRLEGDVGGGGVVLLRLPLFLYFDAPFAVLGVQNPSQVSDSKF